MTVPNANSVDQFTLTSTNQTLALSYTFLEADDIIVIKTSGGADTTLILNSDYTVTLPTSLGATDGSITMTPGTIGDVITAENCPDYLQNTSYVENARFPAKVTERALDKLHMLVNKALNVLTGANSRAIRYPSTELGTNAITPSKTDRLGGGNGTLAAFDGTTGAIDAIAKTTLAATSTLSNDSNMASPDAVNGYTGNAIKTFLDRIIAGVGGLTGLGVYTTKSGTNYIDGNADLNEDITDLDATAKLLENDITNLNTSVTNLESDPQAALAGGTVVSLGSQTETATGSTSGSFTGAFSLGTPPANGWKVAFVLLHIKSDAANTVNSASLGISAPSNYGTLISLNSRDSNGISINENSIVVPVDISSSLSYTINWAITIGAAGAGTTSTVEAKLLNYW
jgi:hypothetical protein